MPDPPGIQPAGQAQGVNPSDMDLATLVGTMSQLGLLGPSQAELAKQQADIHSQVQAAQDQSNQAQQAYQQASNTPLQTSPGEGFFQGLLGNTASVLTQNPQYAKQAASDIDQAHSELLQSRIQNLAALKDTYDRRAAALHPLLQSALASRREMLAA